MDLTFRIPKEGERGDILYGIAAKLYSKMEKDEATTLIENYVLTHKSFHGLSKDEISVTLNSAYQRNRK